VRPSIRFEVFKRDGFTCAYCNRKPPEVTLEADHVIPVAEGGGDEMENLVTACWDCNRGKGAGMLDDRAPVESDLAVRAEVILEREHQLRAYHAAQEEVRARVDAGVEEVMRHWDSKWLGTYYYYPYASSLRKALGILPVFELKDAIDVALDRDGAHNYDKVRYFGGVLKRKMLRAQGRVQTCPGCLKDVVLDDGEDISKQWWHTSCLEKREEA
jgi:hypothetical protein